MPIVAMMTEDNKTSSKPRGITLTLPPKEGWTGRLPKRLLTPASQKVQDFQRGLYLKAKRIAKAFRRWVIGKPCEGKSHARFDEGVVGT